MRADGSTHRQDRLSFDMCSMELCAKCHEPLLLEIESDSDAEDGSSSQSTAPTAVPDDVEFVCGCHFHWECFLEAYTVTECPDCSKPLSSLNANGEQQVLCTVRNEGGVQENFNILPSATDEAYLRAYPEERKGHAFLDFCRTGDIDALVYLIHDGSTEEASEGSQGSVDILRYTGSFEGIEGSGLHVAIRHNQQEVAWLMLAVASSLNWSQFPPMVLHAMESMGLNKEDRNAEIDIRTLEDNVGMTAATVAKEVGGVWSDWSISGRLDPPT